MEGGSLLQRDLDFHVLSHCCEQVAHAIDEALVHDLVSLNVVELALLEVSDLRKSFFVVVGPVSEGVDLVLFRYLLVLLLHGLSDAFRRVPTSVLSV